MASNNELSDEDYANAVFEDGGSLVIDLSNVEALKFEVVPKGIYDAMIDELSFGKSKASGAYMFTIVLKIEGGDYDGRKFYSYASFSPKAIKGTKTTLMRIDPVLFAGQFNPEKIANDGVLLGKSVRIKIDVGEYNGEPQSQVKSIMAPADAAGSESTGGKSFF